MALTVVDDVADVGQEEGINALEPGPVIPAAGGRVFFLEQQPQVAVPVAVDLGTADVAHTVVRDQGGGFDALEFLLGQVIHPKAVSERGDPEPLLLVQA